MHAVSSIVVLSNSKITVLSCSSSTTPLKLKDDIRVKTHLMVRDIIHHFILSSQVMHICIFYMLPSTTSVSVVV